MKEKESVDIKLFNQLINIPSPFKWLFDIVDNFIMEKFDVNYYTSMWLS